MVKSNKVVRPKGLKGQYPTKVKGGGNKRKPTGLKGGMKIPQAASGSGVQAKNKKAFFAKGKKIYG